MDFEDIPITTKKTVIAIGRIDHLTTDVLDDSLVIRIKGEDYFGMDFELFLHSDQINEISEHLHYEYQRITNLFLEHFVNLNDGQDQ